MKLRVAILMAFLFGASVPSLFAQGGSSNQNNYPGGSGSSVGPVINVTNTFYGASPSLVDNAAAFASAASAANTAAYVSVGTPTIRSTTATVMSAGTISSATATVSISAGDTVLVGIIALNASLPTYTISDGVNTYYPVNLNSNPIGSTGPKVQVFGTPPGAAKAFSGALTVTVATGGPEQFGFIVLDAFNVGSYGQTNLTNSSTTTATPTSVVVTQDSNNIFASWVDFCNAAGVTISANTGTLQQSWNSTAAICGGGLVMNSATAALTTVTTSASLGAGSVWTINGIELRSVTTLIPTLYFPAGRYTYSSGLNFTSPVTLKGEPGTVLCYMGNADAIDLGATGLTFANSQIDYYIVDGLRFECGAGMSNGIVFRINAIFGEVKNNVFYNFGNLASAAIYSNGNTQDLSVKLNKFLIFDGGPPTLVGTYLGPARTFVNLTTSSQFSTLTMTNNYAVCISGKQTAGVGCIRYINPLIVTEGYANIISNNSVGGGFCPTIALLGGGSSAAGTRIQDNNFETEPNGCYGITYQTNLDNVKVLNNFWSNKCSTPTTCGFIGPSDTLQVLANWEVSSNTIVNNPTNNPIVYQNNLAGQIDNIGWHNTCSVNQYSTTTPCPILHTAGGSINQWNNDYGGTCTLTTGACTVYNFLTTYGVAPKCTASWTGTGTFTGILKVAVSTSALTITDTVSESTGVIDWACNPEAQ